MRARTAFSPSNGDGISPLSLYEALTTTADNNLISATYTGSAQIKRDSAVISTGDTYGLCIPSGVNAVFSNLTVSISGTSGTSLRAVYVNEGILTFEGSSVNTTGGMDYSVYNQNGTVTVNSGTIKNTSSGTTHDSGTGLCNTGTGLVAVNGGTIEACGKDGKAIIHNSTGTLTMTGGTVKASSSAEDSSNVGISVGGNCGKVTISGGTVSSSGKNDESAAALFLFNSDGSVVDITGTAELTAYCSAVAIFSMSGSSGGTVNITGGTLTSSNSIAIVNYSGTVNLSGGTVSMLSTGSSPYAIVCVSSLDSTPAELNISGTAVISSVLEATIWMLNPNIMGVDVTDIETASIFGKSIHSSNKADIVIKGVSATAGYEINSSNYGDAIVYAANISSGSTFLGWTSDQARTSSISTTNPTTLSSLTTGANSAVTNIYLKTETAAAPDYTITGGPTSFQVDGSGDYTTLASALAVCTGSTPTIQFGGSSAAPLNVTEVFSGSFANNTLIPATYSGWVAIGDDSGVSSGIGLAITSSNTVTLDGLVVTTAEFTQTNFYGVYLSGTGTCGLNIQGDTDITVSGTGHGVYNSSSAGTINMTGGTVAATGGTVAPNGSGATGIYSTGTAVISGGTVSGNAYGIQGQNSLTISGNALVTGSSVGAYCSGTSSSLNINGGIIEAVGVGGKAVVASTNGGTVTMSDGVVRATNPSNASQSVGLQNSNNTAANISGGTITCTGTYNSSAGIYQNSIATVTITGGSISSVNHGIYNMGTKTTDNGSVYINGGSVSSTGTYKYAVYNQVAGLVKIASGTITSSGYAVCNNSTGTVAISGGTLRSTGTHCVVNSDGGTLNITGGTISSESTSAAAIAVSVYTAMRTSTVAISGSETNITSAYSNTISLAQPSDGQRALSVSLYGKIIHGSVLGMTYINGSATGSNYKIDAANYADATLSASDIVSGKSFAGWTSDAGMSSLISGTNGDTLSKLTTGANAGVTDIYLKAAATYSVSGTVSAGFTDVPRGGLTVTLYVSIDSGHTIPLYSGTTDAGGNFTITGVPNGSYVAVVGASSGNIQSVSAAFSVGGANVSDTGITLLAPAAYVITRGAVGTGNYYVYKRASGSADFSELTNAPAIFTIIAAIRNEVSTGSATLYFGLTGTSLSDLTGTLDIGENYIDLGSSGTYTIKGSLTCSDTSYGTIYLSGASVIVDGAFLENTASNTESTQLRNCVNNTGIGSIMVKSGTVQATGTSGCAIYARTGDIVISGGTVQGTGVASGSGSAGFGIKKEGTGDITITGGKVYSAAKEAIIISGGGSVYVSGNTWNDAENTGTLVKTDASSCGSIYMNDGFVEVSGGTVSANVYTISCNTGVRISGGEVTATSGNALCLWGGTSYITGGTITSANTTTTNFRSNIGTICLTDEGYASAMLYISGGTIENTASSGYAVYNDLMNTSYTSTIRLSGTPSISGSTDIGTNTAIYADNDNPTPAPYAGGALTINYFGTITSGTTAAVRRVISGTNDTLFSLTNSGYSLALNGSNLIINADAVTYSVSGTVSAGSTGASVSGLTVTLYASTDTTYATPLYTGTTGASGSYTITGVPNGSYVAAVAASVNSARSASGTIAVNGSNVTSGAAITLQTVGGGGSYGDLPSSNNASVVVDGKTQTAGTVKTTTSGGITTTTVTMTSDDLNNILAKTGSGATITVPITKGADTAVGRLDGQAVKIMESKEATLVIKTDSATYTLPASEINIDAVSARFGESVSLGKITVDVSISQPSNSMVTIVESVAADGGFTIAVPAVEFTVSCTYNGQTVDVCAFNSYVERMIAIPDGVDPSKITTGIVVEADGSIYHVPTEIVVIDGKYYAKINSLTNSVYSVIWNPIKFLDVENHWAKDYVNNMGSRLVVNGVGNNNYDPDRSITRAEFASIMVKALGLQPGTGTNSFNDVDKFAWYCGYIETASSYGIIKGYSKNTFGPNDTITREQALVMIARAMKITGLEVALTESEVTELLGAYTDGTSASNYAEESIAACLKTGIVSGTSENTISPKDCVTRAEVAVMAERLLQKSKLI